jgi:hypothetical protein
MEQNSIPSTKVQRAMRLNATVFFLLRFLVSGSALYIQ